MDETEELEVTGFCRDTRHMESEAPLQSLTLSLQHLGAGEDAHGTPAACCLHSR